ncbi:MAG: sensor histidine kinase [Pleomorphochaeta sp.]
MKSNKTKIFIIIVLSIIVGALLISTYFFAFRFVIQQILVRGDSDTNNLIALINKYDSVDLALENFSEDRDLEIIIVDNNYKVLSSNSSTLRTQYFSNNITFAKSQGDAYSFIRTDAGKTFSLIYSKSDKFNDEIIVVSIEYPFLLYYDFRTTIFSILILAIFILALDTYLITIFSINTYINDLNDYVKNRHLYNEYDETLNKLPLDGNSEVINLLKTLEKFKTRYEDILENNKNRFSKINSLLSIIPSGILIIDTNKNITLMNESANSLLNLKKREILFPKEIDNLKIIYLIWENVCKRNKIEVRDYKLNGKIIEIEAIPLIDKYSPYEFIGVLFLVRDVTKTRELSIMKDEYVSNVSHEIRTPLTIISGFSQALLNSNISEEDKEICINSINEEVNKMTILVEELLQLSRIGKNNKNEEKEIFNPFEVVKNQISLFVNNASEKEINIHIELDNNEKCNLNCNIVYFRQIINNLIDNAIKYSNQKTNILIHEFIDDKYYYFRIKDEGIGIDSESLPYIFERFYRVDKSRNREIAGSGLGLSIVKLLLDTINGQIEVESEVNVGSTFTVKIDRIINEK